MRMLGKISWLVSLLAISSATACGSDDDGGGSSGGALGSGVDQDKPAEDVTDDEAEAICEAGDDYVQDKLSSASFTRSVCRFAAATAALAAGDEDRIQSLCELGYDVCIDCMEDPSQDGCESFETDPTAETECSEIPDDCTVTVGEIEGCYKATLDQVLGMFSDVPSCDELTSDTELPSLDEEPDLPAACETVEENCPEILE